MRGALSRLRKCLVSSCVAVAAVALIAPSAALADVLAPESPHSPNADAAWTGYVVVGIIVTIVGVAGIAGLLMARRRFAAGAAAHRSAERGDSRTQWLVASGLGVIATLIFVLGVIFTEDARELEPTGPDGLADASPLEIKASGQQWLWRYEYPAELAGSDGPPKLFSYYELVVPVDTAVRLSVGSVDVMHRWSVPALAPAATAVPGETNEAWFKADEVGTYEGRSMQYSGPGTAAMRTRVRVVSPDEFESWVEQQAADIVAAQDAVQEVVQSGERPGVSQ